MNEDNLLLAQTFRLILESYNFTKKGLEIWCFLPFCKKCTIPSTIDVEMNSSRSETPSYIVLLPKKDDDGQKTDQSNTMVVRYVRSHDSYLILFPRNRFRWFVYLSYTDAFTTLMFHLSHTKMGAAHKDVCMKKKRFIFWQPQMNVSIKIVQLTSEVYFQ